MIDEQTRIELERLKGQVERLVSDAESEKDTRRRRNKGFDERIKAITEDVHGNGKEGLKIRLDRLERERKILIWVIGVLLAIVVPLIVEYIKDLM